MAVPTSDRALVPANASATSAISLHSSNVDHAINVTDAWPVADATPNSTASTFYVTSVRETQNGSVPDFGMFNTVVLLTDILRNLSSVQLCSLM